MNENEINNFNGEYRFLSNFYQCDFVFEGLTYHNAEAAFQAQKCVDRMGYVFEANHVIKPYNVKLEEAANWQNKISVYSNSLSESAPVYYELGYTDSAFIMIRKALSYSFHNQ